MMRFLTIPLAFALAVLVGPAVSAQDQTLADVRQELQFLYVDIERLKRELSTTGSAGTTTVGATALERLNSIEAQLVRLTWKTVSTGS